MMQKIPFVGPSYTLDSVNAACQNSVNLYLQPYELGTGKNGEVAALKYTPGLAIVASLGTDPIRGLFRAGNERVFAVCGSTLWDITKLSAPLNLGEIASKRGAVYFADNALQLCITDGTRGHILTFKTNVLQQIITTATTGFGRVVFQDGYFITHQPGSRQFNLSAQLDGTSWDGLDFALKEGQSDNLVSIISDHGELWLMGEQSTEVWFDSGDPAFPFTRISGGRLEHGLLAADSLQKLDNSIFWVGSQAGGPAMVWRAQGYTPQRISTFAVEQALQSYGDISKATAFTYQENGHTFYQLNCPNASTSWVYDASTGMWHERTYSAPQQQRHLADCYVFAGGKHLVGDYRTGNVYEMSNAFLTDNGAPVKRVRSTPHVVDGVSFLYYSAFQLDMETGVGVDGLGQGADPQVILQFSDDGGHTWSHELWASAGKIGEFFHRVLWRRLGRSRQRVFRVTITDPVKVTLLSGFVDATPGAD